ncbi:MAG: hypothetical protein ACU843_15465 [Gammaproteobacteria bacterium]
MKHPNYDPNRDYGKYGECCHHEHPKQEAKSKVLPAIFRATNTTFPVFLLVLFILALLAWLIAHPAGDGGSIGIEKDQGRSWDPIQYAAAAEPKKVTPTTVTIQKPKNIDLTNAYLIKSAFARIGDDDLNGKGVLIFGVKFYMDADAEITVIYEDILDYPGAGPLVFQWDNGEMFYPVEVADFDHFDGKFVPH